MPRRLHRLPSVILTASEVEKLIRTPDTSTASGLRNRAIFELLYSTGIRRMELCHLDLTHLDFQRQLLRVEDAYPVG